MDKNDNETLEKKTSTKKMELQKVMGKQTDWLTKIFSCSSGGISPL